MPSLGIVGAVQVQTKSFKRSVRPREIWPQNGVHFGPQTESILAPKRSPFWPSKDSILAPAGTPFWSQNEVHFGLFEFLIPTKVHSGRKRESIWILKRSPFWSPSGVHFGLQAESFWSPNGVHFGPKTGSILVPKRGPFWSQNGIHFESKLGFGGVPFCDGF